MALGGRKTLIAFGVVVALGLSTASTADATLMWAATVGGEDACAVDNNAVCTHGTQFTDLNPAVGILDIGDQSLGGLDIEGSIQAAAAGAALNILASSSLVISNTSGATVSGTFAVSATDFNGPATTAFTSGSGTWTTANPGSSINYEWFNDPNNDQGAETPDDLPGNLIDTFADSPTIAVDSFSHDGGPFAVLDPELFSMSVGVELTLIDGGRLISHGLAEIKPAEAPEPATMALFGLGLAAAAFAQRRRLRRR